MRKDQTDSFSDDNYQCEKCRDSGFLIIYQNIKQESQNITEYDPDFPKDTILSMDEWLTKVDPRNAYKWTQKATMCRCLIEINQRRRMEKIIGQSGLSKKFKKRRFDTFIFLDPARFDEELRPSVQRLVADQRRAFEIAFYYTEKWADLRDSGGGFGFFGDVGTGKSHLLAAKTNRLIEKGVHSVFVNTSDLFNRLRGSFDKDENGKPLKTTRASEIIEFVKNAEDLSLDDVGKEKPTDFVLDVFYDIINHRYENELPTAFSTNCTFKELEDHVGSAIYRRIVEPCAGMMASIKGHSFDQIRHKMKEAPNVSAR